MEERIKWVNNQNARKKGIKAGVDSFSENELRKVRSFHKSFPQYEVTPLRNLSNLAGMTGVSGIYVKDESYRFGLNSFKVLGASYAIGRYLAQLLNLDIDGLSFERFKTEEIREKLGEITFAATSDGNHGRGVAWAAQQLGQKAVIYMPKGSSLIRLGNITATGAEGHITELNYDDTVRLTAVNAQKYGWAIIQDTAWEGYEDIPLWIMQGYAVIGHEALEQLNQQGVDAPTHIFIQAGVGSLAGGIQGYFASTFKDSRPITVVVEPNKADCFYKSVLAGNGRPRSVTGDMDTIMVGLACGEPNPMGWRILWDYADVFISCPDHIAANGMRILGNPLREDPRIVSGESGAVTTGILVEILRNEHMKEIREQLLLDKDSKILVWSTEGDTDPVNYRKIVWDGDI
ncbi:MAG: Diaminopropionate ammonia-lyase [Dehalococcoidia bacterium]|nr:Diaminopropionate ammonia-lyase [Bacillota bacterium]MBT9141663.1 Diaminopropionate ammonia-lyase [Bacillota bacterium]